MLPLPVQAASRIPVRALLGHCFYRRIIVWTVTVIVFLCLVLFSGGVRTRHGRILDHLAGWDGISSNNNADSSSQSGSAGTNVGHNGISTIESSTTENEVATDVDENEKAEDPNVIEKQPTNTEQSADPNGRLHWLKYQQ